MNRYIVGLLLALPLSGIGAVYMLWKGRQMVTALQSGDAELAAMSEMQLFYLFLAGFLFAPFMFGILASLVYGWIGSTRTFQVVALGLGALMSLAAVLTRTPMLGFKLVANLAVVLVFGWLLPMFSRS
jgi:hypothetical protein